MLQDTIAAISTAAVDGAISIIRMSGNDAIDIADRLTSIDLTKKASHTISYGFIIDPITKEEVDEVLISVFHAPKTFTCEDIVEINCHCLLYTSYYTNSFHIPVYYHITAFKKIQKEAPYHEFTNGGHISYVEVDGDPTNNLEAFEAIVRCMKEAGIGYGSINHPVDRDPCCGYSGVIEGHICPKCGRDETKGEYKFEKIRRITGYLVGTVDRFNNGKAAEERDRVKHG